MIDLRNTSDQIGYYEGYHLQEIDLPLERLKQRTRLSTLAELIKEQSFGHGLVVGCGRGSDITVLPVQTTVALDLSWLATRIARQRHPGELYLQADGTRLPFAAGTFDVALCSEVIEHVLHPKQLISEVARVLRPEGHLLLSTPNWVSWWGLARKVGEAILRRPITSGGQPIDDWFTTRRLHRLLSTYFAVVRRLGAWYFPPTGRGIRRLPDELTARVLSPLLPLDRLCGRLVPGMGHLHVWLAVRR